MSVQGEGLSQLSPVERPEVELSAEAPSRIADADVVALPFQRDGDDVVLGPGAAELLDELDVDLLELLDLRQAKGSAGEVVEYPVLDATGLTADGLRSVCLVGVGEARPSDLRRAGAALARRVRGRSKVATSLGALAHDAGLRALAEGLVLGSFTFHRKTTEPTPPAACFVLAGLLRPQAREASLARGLAAARAGWFSRELALVPSNEKNPPWLADLARRVAGRAGLEVEVWDERRLHKDGFGGLLAVGQRLQHAAAAGAARLHARRRLPPYAARGAGRQGHHVRHRRAVDQARRGDDEHEARHDRRGRGPRRDVGARRDELPGPGHRSAGVRRERRSPGTRSAPAT